MTTWEGLIKSVRAKVKGTKVKIRLGASSGEWKAMVADKAARTTFAKNIKTVLEKNKLDGIDQLYSSFLCLLDYHCLHNKTIWSVLMCGVIFTTVVVSLQKACGQVTTLFS